MVVKRMANARSWSYFWLAPLLLLLMLTSAPRTSAATTTVPRVRTLQQQQQQNTTTTTTAAGQELDITYEFRLFIKPDTEELSTQAALTRVQDAFGEHLLSLEDSYSPLLTISSVETRAGGACTNETFTLNAFAQCLHARSIIRAVVVAAAIDAFDFDKNNLQRAILAEVQDYVSIFNAQHGDFQMIYDYPIAVESSIVFILEGANREMDETEKDLFLKNFRIGFEPIMTDGAYEWVDANIVLQLLGRSDGNGDGDGRFLQQQQQQQQDDTTDSNTYLTQLEEPDPNEYNKVSFLLRAICSGGTCQNDNFHNFVMQNTVGFVDDFLLLLKIVDVPQAVLYFGRISAIYVDDSGVVAPLDLDSQVNIVEPGEEKVPSWVWILLAINVFILLCATGWVSYRIHRRRMVRKGVPEPKPKSGFEPAPANENDEQLKSAQDDEFEEQESFPYLVEGDSNDGGSSGYGQGDEDYSQISGVPLPDEAEA